MRSSMHSMKITVLPLFSSGSIEIVDDHSDDPMVDGSFT